MPTPETVARVASVPYDVVSTTEAAALAADNPLSFLRVSRPEIEFPEGTDVFSDAVYDRARANLERLRDEAPLAADSGPFLYLYSLTADGHRQIGLVAAAAVDDYDADVIKKHEKTRIDKENDRTRHALAIGAHTGPVFLIHRPQQAIAELVDQVIGEPPLFEIAADDGVWHRLWRVPASSTETLVAHFGGIPALYVADGHHRAKCASRVRDVCRQKNSRHTGNEPYNRFLTVIFPSDQVRILAYNRVVHDLAGMAVNDFVARVSEVFDVDETTEKTPDGPGHVHMYADRRWFRLRFEPPGAGAMPVERLDVGILQERLLSPILGIEDPRTSARLEFVGGIRGTGELENRVDAQQDGVAFSMFPTQVEQLMALSDAGQIMPPKSTWFEPKLLDGLVCYCF